MFGKGFNKDDFKLLFPRSFSHDLYLQLLGFWTAQVFPRDHHWIESRSEGKSASLSPNTCPVTSESLPVSNSCHSVYPIDLNKVINKTKTTVIYQVNSQRGSSSRHKWLSQRDRDWNILLCRLSFTLIVETVPKKMVKLFKMHLFTEVFLLIGK